MRSATLIGSSLVVLALVGVEVGCKSNNGTGGSGTGGATTSSTTSKATTGATMTTATTGTGTTTTTTGTTTTASSSSGGVMCGPGQTPPCTCPAGPFPPKPNPGPTQTVYCPFSAPTGGMDISCKNKTDAAPQICCETPQAAMMVSSCVAAPAMDTIAAETAACPVAGSIPWACGDASDCGTGKQCCGAGKYNASPNYPAAGTKAGCDNFASSFKGTYCATMCAAGEIVMCATDAECVAQGAGTKCATFSTKGNHVGACTP